MDIEKLEKAKKLYEDIKQLKNLNILSNKDSKFSIDIVYDSVNVKGNLNITNDVASGIFPVSKETVNKIKLMRSTIISLIINAIQFDIMQKEKELEEL